MKRLSEIHPRRVGIGALVAVALIAGTVVVASRASLGTQDYVAHLTNTAGLRAGEDVQVAGVTVGKVAKVRLGDKDVIVSFNMRDDIRLGDQTTAAVRVATLLGTHYLAIDPQGPGDLPNGTIPVTRTEVPYNLQDVIDRGTEAVEAFDPALLAREMTTMSQAMEPSNEEFGPAIRGIARVSEVLADRTAQAGDLLTAARSVSDQLADGSANIVDLMKQTTLVLDEIRTRRTAIHDLLVRTGRLAGALEATVSSTRTDITKALTDVRAVLTMLRGQQKNLKKALELMAPSVRYFANASGSGPWLDTSPAGVSGGILIDGVTCKIKGTC